MACNGNQKEQCKCRHTIKQDVFSDWSKRLKYSAGEVLCLRGGGSCLHLEPFIPQEEEVILHLYPSVFIEMR